MATPVPVNDSESLESDALLAKETVAEAAPLLCGLNVTEYEALLPAGIVIGNVIPERTNSELLLPADVTVTLLPVALRVPVLLDVDPTLMFPKLTLAGDKLSCPCAVPVPTTTS